MAYAVAGEAGAPMLSLDAAAVRGFIARVFENGGWSAADAALTADQLVGADLTGHASHGIGLVPMYVDTIKSGVLNPRSEPATLREDGPFLVIDGNVAMGQVNAVAATQRAIDIAGRHGVALVNLVRSHHIGRVGHYGEMVAARGLIGLFWVNVHGRLPSVVPYAARQPRFSTNPHCVAIPRKGGQPFLLDFATAEFAVNKARVAWAQGRRMRAGSLVDADGRLTDDPSILFREPRGAITAFGEHKGSGLAIACELLSSVLSGGVNVSDQRNIGAICNNMLAIVIDPGRMATTDDTVDAVTDRLVAYIKSALPAEGFDEVLVPGEPEFRARARLGARLEIDPASWGSIVKAAGAMGVADALVPQGKPAST